ENVLVRTAYCLDGDVYEDYQIFTCEGGSCTSAADASPIRREDCGEDTCSNGVCIPREPEPEQPSELEELTGWACTELPRDSSHDMRLYDVSVTTNGFAYTENAELQTDEEDKSAEGNFMHHVIVGQNTGSYSVATAGQGLGEITEMYSGVSGFNPPDCRHVYILNPDAQPVPEEVFSVEVCGTEADATEVVRARTE
ncbi:unnamed protein product, partial [marine sediment metagenome]